MTANNGNRLHVDMMLSSSILLNIVHNIEEEVSSTFGCTDVTFKSGYVPHAYNILSHVLA